MTPWTVVHQALLSMGILQARILEWVAVSSSRGSSNPGIEPWSPALQANSLLSEPAEKCKGCLHPPNKPSSCDHVLSHVQLFCNFMDCSLPGSSVHGILQVIILEWVAMPSSRGSSNPGIEPRSPAVQVDSLPTEPPGKPQPS